MSKFGDTPTFSATSLCVSCRNGQRIKGVRQGDDVTLCRLNGSEPVPITMIVTKCSEYDDKAQPTIWQLEKIAWRFSVDNRKKTVGFLDPGAWKARVKDGLESDDD